MENMESGNINMRLMMLEASQKSCEDARKRNDVVIDRLFDQDKQLIKAVEAVSSNLSILIGKIEIGFKAVCYGCVAIIFVVGTLFAYQKSNDSKYELRVDKQEAAR